MRILASLTISMALIPSAFAVPDSCDAYGDLSVGGPVVLAETIFHGASRNDGLGRAIAHLDINGDGNPDIAIGAPGDDTNGTGAGAVYVFLGPIGATGDLDPSRADFALVGPSNGYNAGRSIASAGDLDGDGFDDLVIGSEANLNTAHPEGVAWVFRGGSGLSGTIDLATADAEIRGANPGDGFGISVAGVGSVDSSPDLGILIGAPLEQTNGTKAGAAYLFVGVGLGGYTTGDAASSWLGVDANDGAGTSLAALGDVNGDGYADFGIGAPKDNSVAALAGGLYVVYGEPTLGVGGTVTDADVHLFGGAYDRGGTSAASAGDVNGDGYGDFWVGAEQWGSLKRGAAYLIYGDASLAGPMTLQDAYTTRIIGYDASDLLGSSIDGNADFNSDGFLDVVIGAERADGGTLAETGAGWVFNGPFETNIVAGVSGAHYAQTRRALAGSVVVALPDFDGDGFDDILIGGWRAGYAGIRRPGIVGFVLGGEDVLDEITWYADVDNDTWGDDADTIVSCTQPPGSYVSRGGDCDDNDSAFHPFAVELDCGSIDDLNCDGSIQADDADNDGVTACAGDCDDNDADVFLGNVERCGDLKDNDCDGLFDDASAVDAPTWYPDTDEDGYGNMGFGVTSCEDPGVFLTDPIIVGGDCDDLDAAVNPAAAEFCDTIDNDCDSVVDEADAIDAPAWYPDADGDGYGDFYSPARACSQPVGMVSNTTDCDDTDGAVKPGSIEVCDFKDNDCDGQHYLGGPVPAERWALRMTGQHEQDRFGRAIEFVPDMNGDGYPELVIGAPLASLAGNQSGTAYVKYGGPDQDDLDLAVQLADGSWSYDAKILPVRASGQFGDAVTAGDFNGDGIGDIVVSAPSESRGGIYMFHGPLAGDIAIEDADASWAGTLENDFAGISLDAGDLDGDGFDDLLIGANREDGGADQLGAMHVIYGSATPVSGRLNNVTDAVLYGQQDRDRLGTAVAVIGDVNGDGFVDIAAGAPESGLLDTGFVSIVFGTGARHSGTLAADVLFVSDRTNERLGAWMADLGDVNGDGISDLGIGSEFNRFFLVYGANDGSVVSDTMRLAADVIISGQSGEVVSRRVVGAGDVDNDGYADFLLSANRADFGEAQGGGVYLVYGGPGLPAEFGTEDIESFGRLPGTGTFPTYSAANSGGVEGAFLYGTERSAGLGVGLAGGVDWNLDGYPDVVTGAAGTLENTGRVFVVLAGPYGHDYDDGTAAAWNQSVTVDGDSSDWLDEMVLDTTRGAPTRSSITWDDEYLYFGAEISTVGTGGNLDYLAIYLGNGGAGSANGISLGSQQPLLPFTATHALVWRADDAYNAWYAHNGATWIQNVSWLGTAGSFYAESDVNQVVEFAIPLSEIGDPATVEVMALWAFTGVGSEQCFGGVPNTAFADGATDPDPTEYFRFSLSDALGPASYGSLPTGGGAPDVSDTWSTFVYDRDADGHGDDLPDLFDSCPMHIPISFDDPSNPVASALEMPVGPADDCNDSDPAIFPGAPEAAGDGIDSDCDGNDEQCLIPPTWYPDGDGDNYGRNAGSVVACDAPSGFVADGGDCDDVNPAINPGQAEICNGGIDDDCDPGTTENAGGNTFYADTDGDGFGDPLNTATGCVQPSGMVANSDDCDDTDPLVNPDADELCSDTIDNDCDTQINEFDAIDALTWYDDLDGDNFGGATSGTRSCIQLPFTTSVGGDCDDTNPTINPDATELCNGIDDDCDPLTTDEDGGGGVVWYYDGDSDGFGDLASTPRCTPPVNHIAQDGDCNDSNSLIYPGAPEACDGLDYDCDGQPDSGCPVEHCGNITTNEMWAAGVIHTVTCDVYVQGVADPTLTIADGAVVKFQANAGLWIGQSSDGALVADGSANGILLTSDQAVPTPGDWDGLYLGGSDLGSTLTGVTVSYGGSSGNIYSVGNAATVLTDVTTQFGSSHGIRMAGGSLEINGCTSSDNNGDGIDVTSGTVLITDCMVRDNGGNGIDLASAARLQTDPLGPTLANSTITGNQGVPVRLPADYASQLADSNSFSGNNDDRIWLWGDTVTTSGTWPDLLLPYYIDSDVYIQGGGDPIITLLGDEVQFNTSADLYVGQSSDGGLVAEGGAGRILFTGTQAVPAPGNWGGLYFGSSTIGTSIQAVDIEFSGYASASGIYTTAPLITFDDVSVRSSAYIGVRVAGGNVTITNSTIEENGNDGVDVSSGTVTIANSIIQDNNNIGVDLASAAHLSEVGGPTFSGNTITGNGDQPIRLPANYGRQLADNGTYSGNGDDRIWLWGDTVEDSGTWLEVGVPWFINSDTYVQGGADPVLTIEALTTELGPNVDLYIAQSSDGGLMVPADPAGLVRRLFTSAQPLPAAGDWGGITFGSYDVGSVLADLDVEFGGYSIAGNIYSTSPNLTLTNLGVRDSSGNGIRIGNGFATITDSLVEDNGTDGVDVSSGTVLFSGNTVRNNTNNGVDISSSGRLDETITPTFAGNTITGNGDNPVRVLADYARQLADDNTVTGNGDDRIWIWGDVVTQSGTWLDVGIPYYINSDVNIYGAADPIITIEVTELQFETNADLNVATSGDGGLLVPSATGRTLFTSDSPTPGPGDWGGLSFGSFDKGSVINDLDIEYAGQNGSGNIYSTAPNLVLTGVQSTNSSYTGIRVASGVVSMTGCTASNNGRDGIEVSGGTALIQDTTASGNVEHGFDLGTSAKLDETITPTFTGNTATGNGDYPVRVPGDYVRQLDATSTYTGNGDDRIWVWGDVVTDSGTWQELGLPFYIDSDINIYGSADPVITIQTLELQFNTNADLNVASSGDGGLVVPASVTRKLFTSAKTIPGPGDWAGVTFGSFTQTGSMANVEVEYAGQNGSANIYSTAPILTLTDVGASNGSVDGIHISSGVVTMTGVVAANNGVDGIEVSAGTVTITGSTAQDNVANGVDISTSAHLSTTTGFTTNTLTGNGDHPIRLPGNYARMLAVSSSYSGNSDDLIWLWSDVIDTTGTWLELGVPYYVDGDLNIYGNADPVITIEGLEFQFNTNADLNVGTSGDGGLVVPGDIDPLVRNLFTSSSASPSPGAWGGITVGSFDLGSSIAQADVEYGGQNGVGNIYAYSANMTLTDIGVRLGSNSGVYVSSGNTVLTGSVIEDNGKDGVEIAGGEVLVQDCTLQNNTLNGLDVSSSGKLDATTTPSFTNNVLTGNGDYPARVPANYARQLDASSTFTGNGDDRIWLWSDVVEQSGTWQELGVPFFADGTISIYGNSDPVITVLTRRIEFDRNAFMRVGTSNDGGLIVPASGSPAVFTSAAVVPAPGDWGGIEFGASSLSSSIADAVVSYAGYSVLADIYTTATTLSLTRVTANLSSGVGLYQGSGTVTVDSCSFDDNADDGANIAGGTFDAQDSTFDNNNEHGLDMSTSALLAVAASPTFTGNSMVGNGQHPLRIAANFVAMLDVSSTYSGNGDDRVRVWGDVVTYSGTWQLLDVPYLIHSDVSIYGALDPLITIENGVELQFATGADLNVATSGDGALFTEPGTLVTVMTSEKAVPAQGDWPGLTIGSFALASTELNDLEVSYAGSNNIGGINITSTDMTLNNVTSRNNRFDGLYATGSMLLIQDSTFSNNEERGIDFTTSAGLATNVLGATFTGNTLTGNGGYAMSLAADYARELDVSSTYSGNTDDRVALLGDTVERDGTWQAIDVPFFAVGDITVQGTGSPVLTIVEGVEVQFNTNVDLRVGSSQPGRIEVDPVVTVGVSPVTFTSGQGTPAPGDWAGISLSTYDTGSIIDGAIIEFGGSNNYGGVYIYGSAPTLINTTVRNNTFDGIDISYTNSGPVIQGCTITGNQQVGVHYSTSSIIPDEATPGFKDNVVTGNGGYGVRLPANEMRDLDASSTYSPNGDDHVAVDGDIVDTTGSWQALDAPYLMLGDVSIYAPSPGPHITINDGVVMEHNTNVDIIVGSSGVGRLTSDGGALGVLLTSSKALPSAGDWGGVTINSQGGGSVFTNTTIEFGGSNGQGGLYIAGADVSVDSCTFSDNLNNGLYVTSGLLTATNSVFSDNTANGLKVSTSASILGLSGNTYTGNGGYPVELPGNYVGELGATDAYTGNTSDLVHMLADTVDIDQTWAALDVDYRVGGDLTIQKIGDVQVIIDDGATFYFGANAGIIIAQSYPGSLVIDGHTAGVTMTGTTASPGHWDGLSFYNQDSGSSILGLTIEYGGANNQGNVYLASVPYMSILDSVSQSSSRDGLSATGGTVLIQNSSFLANLQNGVDLSTSMVIDDTGGPTFINNIMDGNGWTGIRLPANEVAQLDASSSYDGNSYLIEVSGDTITETGSWQALDEDYQIKGGIIIQATTNPVLTIEDGCSLYFDNSRGLTVGQSYAGGLVVNGSTLGVLFTSSAVTPGPGIWQGLYAVNNTTVLDLSGLTVEYGTYSSFAGIYVSSTATNINNVIVTDSSYDGLHLGGTAVASVTNSTFNDNADDGVYVAAGITFTAPFAGNTMTGNLDSPINLVAEQLGALAPSSTFVGNGDPILVRGGTVSSTQTWNNLDEIYQVTSDITVQGIIGPVVTIEGGTTMLFNTSRGISVATSQPGGLFVDGSLDPVIMTSSAGTPVPGSWDGVAVGSYCTTFDLQGLDISYGGTHSYAQVQVDCVDANLDGVISTFSSQEGLYISQADAVVTNSVFSDNAEYGVRLTNVGGLLVDTMTGPTFTNNTLTGNTLGPIQLYPKDVAQLDVSSSFSGNTVDRIFVRASTLSQTAAWALHDVDYYSNGTISIQGALSPVLTLDPGVTWTFGISGGIYVGQSTPGGLIASGTALNPVTFTSDAATPVANDWQGIVFWSSCLPGSSVINNAEVSYAGRNSYGNVMLYQCEGTVTNSSIHDSSRWGIGRYSATGTISGNTYASNANGNVQ